MLGVEVLPTIPVGNLLVLGVVLLGFWQTRRAFIRLDGRIAALERDLSAKA